MKTQRIPAYVANDGKRPYLDVITGTVFTGILHVPTCERGLYLL